MKNRPIQFIANAISTNELLTKSVRENASKEVTVPNVFALYTDFQTAGKGMGTNTWFSDKDKNLLVSFYFKTTLPAAQQFLFNAYFAVTTRNMLARYIPNVQIKWPNDIYVNGKKIAGILIEHGVKGGYLYQTIAGIGININQDVFPENIPHPTSVFIETGRQLSVESFLKEYQDLLIDQFEGLSLSNSEILYNQYLEHLYLRNVLSCFQIHGQTVQATIQGIDSYGQLCLIDEQQKEYVCGFKEIVFLR